MRVRYDKLWRLMKDNRIKKSELAKSAEISSYVNLVFRAAEAVKRTL